MQRVEELALEAPFELGIVEIARVKSEIISVHGHGFIFEFNDDFYALALGARGKIKERMLVEAQLGEDTVEADAGSFRHEGIVKQTS